MDLILCFSFVSSDFVRPLKAGIQAYLKDEDESTVKVYYEVAITGFKCDRNNGQLILAQSSLFSF
jgi:hypothetical protein